MTETERAREWRHNYAAKHGISPDGEDVWNDEIVAAYASERVAGLKRFAFHRFDCEADGNIHHSNAYRWRDGDEATCTCGLALALGSGEEKKRG